MIEMAAAGSTQAFETLYLRTAPWLLSKVRRWLSYDEAEDVLAEVYLQIWQSVCKYDSSRGTPIAWISVIAKSRSYDLLRRRAILPVHEIDTDALFTHDTPERLMEDTQRRQLVARSLQNAGLNCRERELLCLAYFGDSTQQEIASATGIPLGTVKSTISRAQRKLRVRLAPILDLGQAEPPP